VNDWIVWRLVRSIAASIPMCAFAACGAGTRATPAEAPPLEVEVATVSERDVAVSSVPPQLKDGAVVSGRWSVQFFALVGHSGRCDGHNRP
jgi:hypothetical protein